MTTHSPWTEARSNIAGIEFPAIVGGPTGTLAALVRQLDDTQWLSAEAIGHGQFAQLHHLARYAAQYSSHFRKRLAQAKLRPDGLTSLAVLRRLPVMHRRDLQSGEGIVCTEVPASHRPVGESKTSGSTGEPIVAKRTAINQLMWMAMTMREHFWTRSSFDTRLAAIRANIPQLAHDKDWGAPASLLFRTGPSLRLPITLSVETLVAHLAEFKPASLIVYPNTLDAISRHCAQAGIAFEGLRTIRTIGETLSADIRSRAQEVFRAPVADNYSSQELGNIALQCPESGLYHVMAESLIVEVIDGSGAPCKPGEIGRVVVSDLHNFATPLIRYDIGDYAEPAEPCPCGRGLPSLKRIVGRERNLIVMPDGTRHWPLVGFHRFREIAPVAQYQMIQHALHDIEVRLVVEAALTPSQEKDLREVIQKALGHPFVLRSPISTAPCRAGQTASSTSSFARSPKGAQTKMPGTHRPGHRVELLSDLEGAEVQDAFRRQGMMECRRVHRRTGLTEREERLFVEIHSDADIDGCRLFAGIPVEHIGFFFLVTQTDKTGKARVGELVLAFDPRRAAGHRAEALVVAPEQSAVDIDRHVGREEIGAVGAEEHAVSYTTFRPVAAAHIAEPAALAEQRPVVCEILTFEGDEAVIHIVAPALADERRYGGKAVDRACNADAPVLHRMDDVCRAAKER